VIDIRFGVLRPELFARFYYERLGSNNFYKDYVKGLIAGNIKRGVDSFGVRYSPLTYIGFGSRGRLGDVPLERLPYVVLRNSIVSRLEGSRIVFSFSYSGGDSKRYLIHNLGGVVYNPYARSKSSVIPRRQYLYIDRRDVDGLRRVFIDAFKG
jgi:hypothetical protein